MRRKHLISKPTRNQDIRYEDYYDELNKEWEEKARALQMRRWRALKHEIKRAY
ncbi:MAG: hypothetical protein ACYCPS_04210 [Candidatus Saccharimonadales bacterium]